VNQPQDDPPPPEDIDEMIAQAREFMFATDLADSLGANGLVPEALALNLTLLRQIASNMRMVADTARRHPQMLKELPDLLDKWAGAFELLARYTKEED
jgi:hypothetical protein